MAKKTFSKATKRISPKAATEPSGSDRRTEPQELNGHQEPLKRAALRPVSAGPQGAAKPAKVKVRFAVLDLGARQVSLSGEFNGWLPNATPMTRHDDGHWETTVELAPGRYQYKFVVDGNWIPDPLAHENVSNTHGTLNSVVQVPPVAPRRP